MIREEPNGVETFIVRPRVSRGLIGAYLGACAGMLAIAVGGRGSHRHSPEERLIVLQVSLVAVFVAAIPVIVWAFWGSERLVITSSGIVMQRLVFGLPIWWTRVRPAEFLSVESSSTPITGRLARGYWEKYLISGDSTVVIHTTGGKRVWAGAWTLMEADTDAVVTAINTALGAQPTA